MKRHQLIIFLCLFLCNGCTGPTTAAITSSDSQLMTRQAQTREYESVSKKQAMRAAIATLQDLDFILDKIDADLGTVSASKYKRGASVKITINVREKTSMVTTIRANATYGEKPIENPFIYQDFFSNLNKSLFLTDSYH